MSTNRVSFPLGVDVGSTPFDSDANDNSKNSSSSQDGGQKDGKGLDANPDEGLDKNPDQSQRNKG